MVKSACYSYYIIYYFSALFPPHQVPFLQEDSLYPRNTQVTQASDNKLWFPKDFAWCPWYIYANIHDMVRKLLSVSIVAKEVLLQMPWKKLTNTKKCSDKKENYWRDK